jgi:hypothetical protein
MNDDDDDNDDAYIKKILFYCNKILANKCLDVILSKNSNNKIIYEINFVEPDWFNELDDNLKYNIMENLKSYIKKQSIKVLEEENYDNFTNLKFS